MSKLVIQHGERQTEHVLGEDPLVVGRDPQCDLFFADKKLSRRHARFERDGETVKLVDLGSRNGSWVNEKRIDEKTLSSGDEVRLGALKISLEAEAQTSPGDEDSTIFIGSDTPSDDSRTVVLSRDATPDVGNGAPDEDGTVLLPKIPDTATQAVPAAPLDTSDGSADDEDPTLNEPDSAPDRTIVLPGEQSSQPSFTDTGTVIFRGKVDPEFEAATRLAAQERASSEAPDSVVAEDTGTRIVNRPDAVDFGYELDAPAAVGRRLNMGLGAGPGASLRFGLLVAAVVLLAFSVLALPLIRTLGRALATESALRGELLVELLATGNAEALGDGAARDVSVDRVAGQPGVRSAFVLDAQGAVLASFGEDDGAAPLRGLGPDVEPSGIRTPREAAMEDDTTLLVQPITVDGAFLGLAVLHYRTGTAVSGRTRMMMLLGALLLLMGVGAALLMARRWTLAPVRMLRDDVEALTRGYVGSLPEDRPDADLIMIARGFNDLLRQRGDGDASATYKPVVDPTLVPDD